MFDEEYIYLAGLTHNTALIAWGKFFFDDSGRVMDRGALETIGMNSAVYAQPFAEISIRNAITDEALQPIASVGANHCLVRGLKPDTEYRYTIKVKEGDTWRVWGANPHRIYDVRREIMRPALPGEHRAYNNRFRTYPDPSASANLKFLALGDYGRADETQIKVAEAMKRFVNGSDNSARFILTMGDNIYTHSTGSGEHDDDWFDSFFQPYRYIINQIPVYPAIGNHDSAETHEFQQGAEERREVYENFYIPMRFGVNDAPMLPDWKNDSGLFYRFQFGKDITFICLDTSSESRRINGENFSGCLAQNSANIAFVEQVFTESQQNGATWCIPFGHHPPYSRGDRHGDTKDLRDLVNRVRDKGLRVFFCGHDHNFQYLTKDRTKPAKEQDTNLVAEADKCHFLLSGGGSKPRSSKPTQGTKATLRAWGGTDEGHFLAVTIAGKVMTVETIGENGTAIDLLDRANDDQTWNGAIEIHL